MMFLAVDIGNTRIHAAVFDSAGKMLHRGHVNTLQDLPAMLEDYQIGKAIVSSVKPHQSELFPLDCPLLNLSHLTPLPFDNAYKTPETLGKDRIAAMAAASALYPSQAVLVFDIGTCMTIDFLSPAGLYEGGNISPGKAMRFRAMHEYTDALPLVSETDFRGTAGTDTASALAAGVVCGMTNEIEAYISRYRHEYPGLKVILCGGDSIYFEKHIKTEIFAVPELVLHGLYHILRFND